MLARSGPAAAATRSSSASRSSGTASGRCSSADHGHVELRGPQRQRLHAALPGGARAGARARLAPDHPRRRDRRASTSEGRPSFERLQSRMHLALGLRRQAPHARHPGDLRDLRPALPRRPHDDARSPTRSAASCSSGSSSRGPRGARPPTTAARARALLEATQASSASRASWRRSSTARTSPARARRTGSRSRTSHTQDVVIGGWTPGEGGRSGEPRRARGRRDGGRQARLRRQGRHRLHRADARARSSASSSRSGATPVPFAGRQPPKGTVFVEPRLVAHVEFREWTKSGTLRAPSFKGLRPDVSPQECVREEG